MTEVYSTGGRQHPVSSKKVREMKKKALQSYKKIPTIRQRSDAEKAASGAKAEQELDNFIQKL